MLRRANTHALAAIAIAGLAVTGLMACPAEETEQPADTAYLDVDVSPRQIPADGTTADVSIIATEANGALGEGSVVVRATAGQLDGAGEANLTLANGRATVKYSCNAAEDSNCLGAQKVTVEWKGVTGGVRITLVAETPDAGTPDAGEADAGELDAGEPDAGAVDAGPSVAAMELTASRDRLFVAVGDFAEVTAKLTDGQGGMGAERIKFETTRGGLAATSTGTPAASLELTTNGDGVAKAYFFETGAIGTAQITATQIPADETAVPAVAKVVVEVVRVRQISWAETTCSGEVCTIMGIRGSGFNEQAQVVFQVVDSIGKPVEGMNVTFEIEDPPSGTTVAEDGITDAQGRVTANVSAGTQIGVFAVKATAVEGEVEASSPSIGIRGAKASNHGFSLYCSPVNNTVLGTTANWDPLPVSVTCNLKIVDRFNNPVGTMATPVQFKVEAGSIPNAVTTLPYSPGGDNAEEGTAQITFSTMGGPPSPIDVAPLPAAAGQWPFPREAEPSTNDGSYIIRNPRDGLVTVLAYVRGEEFYRDENSNGVHDLGEQFIDQGEPFVDANDNGTWDPGEIYIDVSPADGAWNGPNGKRDADSTIWTETRILYTSRPDPRNSFLSLAPPTPATTFGTVTKGSLVPLYAYFGDINLNRVQSSGTSFGGELIGSKGNVDWKVTSILDSYGFGIDRRLVSASDEMACTPATQVCRWKLMFYDWSKGYSGFGFIEGAELENEDPAAPALVRVNAMVKDVDLVLGISGTIE